MCALARSLSLALPVGPFRTQHIDGGGRAQAAPHLFTEVFFEAILSSKGSEALAVKIRPGKHKKLEKVYKN